METLSGTHKQLQTGLHSSWANFTLFIVYDLIVITGIVAGKGVLKEPWLAIAEVLTFAGAPLLVFLMAAIHVCTPQSAKTYSLVAFGWMLLLAGSTVIVHFVNLTVWRQISFQQKTDTMRFLGWEWPSVLYAIELVAWHLFFGLSMLFAGIAFKHKDRERTVRIALTATGLLCILGLIGPLSGDLSWRLIGMLGYGVGFPIACAMIAREFRHATVA